MRNGLRIFTLGIVCTVSFIYGCSLGGNPRSASDRIAKNNQAREAEAWPGEPCGLDPENAWDIVRVFYGTDRKPTGDSTPNNYYGPEPSALQYGMCEVSIPPSHDYGEIERPSIWKLEFNENPDRHVMLQSIEAVEEDRFLKDLQDDVKFSGSEEAFVFVHGYNVSFAHAARRTAQMAHDLRFQGPPIMFSWPSQGKLPGYVADMTSADFAKEHVLEFVEKIARDSGAKKVHLIAHSMGNRIVTDVLKNLSEQSLYRDVPKFNQVILAAPDIDARTFKYEIAPKITQADRVTIYASSNDKALKASQLVHQGRRLGQGGIELTVFPEQKFIDMIDASQVDFGLFELGHASYADGLLVDVKRTLSGAPVISRGLTAHESNYAWLVPGPLRPIADQPSEIQTASMETISPEVAIQEPPQETATNSRWTWWKIFWPF
ncbi:MAG TPA: hypothetical protein DD473_05825 [Planctomycetaceae bacterium]|nr:hypothetical protein [Planctomycetaceae bacterium]